MSWILLKGGHVFDPEDRGIADVLILTIGSRPLAPIFLRRRESGKERSSALPTESCCPV